MVFGFYHSHTCFLYRKRDSLADEWDGGSMRVMLTGGGTAGHINPALAIAETVRRNCPDAEILFVGIKGGKEDDLVVREGYDLEHVRSMGLIRALSKDAVKAIWLALCSPYFKDTTGLLDSFKPDIVIGTGGYARHGPL